MSHPIHHDTDGAVSHDSEFDREKQEPWLARWWALLVIAYGLLVAMFCLAMTNATFGH